MINKGIYRKPKLNMKSIRNGLSTEVNIITCLVDFNHKWL